jgi:fumarate reductase flavoprotein subunit
MKQGKTAMPRRVRLLGILILQAAFSGCLSVGPGYVHFIPGFYEGTGEGFMGPIHLMVQVDATRILGIEILEHHEDNLVGGTAMEELTELILDSGSTDVDGISGATESSAGFLAAVEEALSQAIPQRQGWKAADEDGIIRP